MRRTILALLASLALALMLALSTAVAMASLDFEDCPPVSSSGLAHLSPQAQTQLVSVIPPANDNAWLAGNPGNKYR